MIEELNQVQEQIEQPTTEAQPQEQQQAAPEDRIEQLRAERKQRNQDRKESYKKEEEKQQVFPQAEEEEIQLADDDLAEGKHIKRYAKKIKQLEEKLKSYEQNSAASTAELRLKSQFPDFDKVVTTENLELLRDLEPDIAISINANNDLYTKASAAYKMIKKFGIYREDVYKQDKELAYTNATKPRPLASVSPQQGESPLNRANAFANGLTNELKEQLLKEMQEARKKG
jgi:hypothetical protein